MTELLLHTRPGQEDIKDSMAAENETKVMTTTRIYFAVAMGIKQRKGGLNVKGLRALLRELDPSNADEDVNSMLREELIRKIKAHAVWRDIEKDFNTPTILKLKSNYEKMMVRYTKRKTFLGVADVAVAEHYSGKSPSEDKHKVLHGSGVTILAVFDGHGGLEASQYANENLPQAILEAVVASDKSSEAISAILLDKFALVHQGILDEKMSSGTCATVCVLTRTQVIAANVGDSPAIMFTAKGRVLEATVDHDCRNKAEANRMRDGRNPCIRFPDGLVRVTTGLAPTRALGQSERHTGVSPVPDICVWERKKNAYLCVCSDSFSEGVIAGTNKLGPVQDTKEIVDELLMSIRKRGVSLEDATFMAVDTRVRKFTKQSRPKNSTPYDGDNTTLLATRL